MPRISDELRYHVILKMKEEVNQVNHETSICPDVQFGRSG